MAKSNKKQRKKGFCIEQQKRKGKQQGRQEMRDPDSPARPSTSRSRDGDDSDHQHRTRPYETQGRSDGQRGDDELLLNDGRVAVETNSNPNLAPLGARNRLASRDEDESGSGDLAPSASSQLGGPVLLQIDGSHEDPRSTENPKEGSGERVLPEGFHHWPQPHSKPAQEQHVLPDLAHPQPQPAPALPRPDPTQDLTPAQREAFVAEVTRKLREELGLTPEAVANLLRNNPALLPVQTSTPGEVGVSETAATASKDPRLRDREGRVVEGLPPRPDVPSPPPFAKEQITGIADLLKNPTPTSTSTPNPAEAEAKPEAREPTMSHTQLLIPRAAGITLKNRPPSPPLVDVPAPDKSKIVVASQYLFQHDLEAAGLMSERDVSGRLQGVGLIERVRTALRMPMKTFGTACVFFLRYRYHVATAGSDSDAASRYDFRDAALASLWLASKAEETPKKSKEILCAFRNTSLPPEEHLSPDDEVFEPQAKLMINLERYLLEIVAFDFRARNCGELLAGLCVELGVEKGTGRVAMAVALDLYRTLAVLKMSRQTMAVACIEMAGRFGERHDDVGKVIREELYQRVGTSRQEVLETLFDLIELYLNHHAITAAGSKYAINDFMRVSGALRTEMKQKGYERYTYIQEAALKTSPIVSPMHSTPTLMGTPMTPANREGGRDGSKKVSPRTKGGEDDKMMLVDEKDIELGRPVSPPPSYLLNSPSSRSRHSISNGHAHGSASPTSPTSPLVAEASTNPDDPSQVKEVVRFVLDASRARDEDLLRRPFHAIETVELVEENTLYIPRDGSSEAARAELELKSAPAPVVAPVGPAQGGGKMRNGDVEMRDAPPAPSGPRGLPPMGPKDRRRSPPPGHGHGRWGGHHGGRDDRGYGRRDDRRW